MIALLSSMPFESERIFSSLTKTVTHHIAGKKLVRGRLSGREVLLFCTGIGKVNAAQAATAVIEKFAVERVINFGIAGSYPDAGLDRGDVAVATEEVLADDGVITSKGFRGMEEIGIPVVSRGRRNYFNEYPLDASLPGSAAEGRFRIHRGRFLTVSAASGTMMRARELEQAFQGICENMEGAAVAQVCALYGIPMQEVRGISNAAGVRDRRRWNMKDAAVNCQSSVMQFIKP